MNTSSSKNGTPRRERGAYDILMLDNQLCFSLYVCSKEIIKKYKALLEPFGLTYTGYIIMMALWEKDNVTVKELGSRLYLDSGTLTPMLKKLEAQDFIKRIRSSSDERNVYIQLTSKGLEFKEDALNIPKSLICNLDLDPEYSGTLLNALHEMMERLENSGDIAAD
ncbi:DNA-binding MarR family transcriptional regulator [Anaerotaenia torta]|uniref:MarR family winged helix-turn-helix transcriptional regulator n=1 Tax=Anaerotaenia torta TaxID=433293 RepID=UPI003D23B6CC